MRRMRPVTGSGSPAPAYRRDQFTWFAFGGLLIMGLLQAMLGPALPYLRAYEHLAYLPAAGLQAAFAVGGGLAGLLSTGPAGSASSGPGWSGWAGWVRALSRPVVLRGGLAGMAVAGLLLGYVNVFVVSLLAALAMSLFGTSATIRFWAALADEHAGQRTVAMAEGEVCVSTGSILSPLAISAAAAIALGWRFAFVAGAIATAVVLAGSLRVPVPPESPPAADPAGGPAGPRSRRLPPLLAVVVAVVAMEFSLTFWLASYLNDDVGTGRGTAVAMVSVLYAASLAGRLAASRLARRVTAAWLLAGALAVACCGFPLLLAAHGAVLAGCGVAVCGVGIGAMFPLTSSLHVGSSGRTSTAAVGQVMAMAAIGQLGGPLVVGAIAQASSLRAGLILLPGLAVAAAAGLAAHQRRQVTAAEPG
jgi:MFS family permease